MKNMLSMIDYDIKQFHKKPEEEQVEENREEFDQKDLITNEKSTGTWKSFGGSLSGRESHINDPSLNDNLLDEDENNSINGHSNQSNFTHQLLNFYPQPDNNSINGHPNQSNFTHPFLISYPPSDNNSTNEQNSNVEVPKERISKFHYVMAKSEKMVEKEKNSLKEEFKEVVQHIISKILNLIFTNDISHSKETIEIDFSKKSPIEELKLCYAFIQEMDNNTTLAITKVFDRYSKTQLYQKSIRIINNNFKCKKSDEKFLVEYIENVYKIKNEHFIKLMNFLVTLGIEKVVVNNYAYRYLEKGYKEVIGEDK